MNRLHIATLPLAALLLLAGNAWSAPTVITFEEFGGGEAPIPDGYFGFDWENMWTINGASDYPGSGYENGAVSGVRTAFNGFADPAGALTVSGHPFNFIGAYFTSAWEANLSITVDGYLDGSLEYTSTFQVDTTGPTFAALNYANIDELRLSSNNVSQFAMDDFTFTAIPEPSSLTLLGLGLLGLGFLRRRS